MTVSRLLILAALLYCLAVGQLAGALLLAVWLVALFVVRPDTRL